MSRTKCYTESDKNTCYRDVLVITSRMENDIVSRIHFAFACLFTKKVNVGFTFSKLLHVLEKERYQMNGHTFSDNSIVKLILLKT